MSFSLQMLKSKGVMLAYNAFIIVVFVSAALATLRSWIWWAIYDMDSHQFQQQQWMLLALMPAIAKHLGDAGGNIGMDVQRQAMNKRWLMDTKPIYVRFGVFCERNNVHRC